MEIYLLLDSFTEPPYAPQVNDFILFLEEAEEDDYHDFDRNLAAILQAYPNPKAVLIGRFPKKCQMTPEILTYILDKSTHFLKVFLSCITLILPTLSHSLQSVSAHKQALTLIL